MPFLGTHLQVAPLDGFLHSMANTTRLTKGCAYLRARFADMGLYLWKKIPKTINFISVNRRFQVKHAKYSKIHINACQI